MYLARSIRSDGREEILRFQAVRDVIEFLAVAREENGSSAGTVADAYDVALVEWGAICCGSEGLGVSPYTGREVGK